MAAATEEDLVTADDLSSVSAPRRRRRRLWIAAIVTAVAAPALAYRHHVTSTRDVLRFETATIDRGRVVSRVTASGTLSAIVTVQVGSQVSGRIQRIFVDYNSAVHKGELIAQLDPALFGAAYEQAKANHVAALGNLAKAEAQARDADLQARRSQSLLADKLIAQADFDTAQANADAAHAAVTASRGSVEQTQAALHQAQINLAYTRIYSPTDGVVISRDVDVGQTVAASLQAPTLFVIAEDLRKMQVDTSVAEADIGRLRDGTPASFTVDAYPGETFRGTVRQIRNAPQTIQNVVTYDAVIDIGNEALKLKPGMTANVTFLAAERRDVLRLPNGALRFRPSEEVLALAGVAPERWAGRRGAGPRSVGAPAADDGGQVATSSRRVFVLVDGKPRAVAIKIGISDGSVTQIVEGPLKEGDKVILDATGAGAASVAEGRSPGGPARRVF
jgi:HlyD family secretion protein